MNEKFLEYFKTEFFSEPKILEEFRKSLFKPLKRTIRVNLNKKSIKEVKKRLENQNYTLTETFQPNIFYVEKNEKFDEFERRLGFTLEHLMGYFYIQELGASTSVYYLTGGKIDKGDYLILDMAASPGGKTTQLTEYFPNSFIVANEYDKNRTAQLIANIERMGCENIGICNYNGQYLGRFTETFDKVLLDAPCSGEGIGFKNQESLKFWNLKNVKKISEVQKKLFEAGMNALKVGGEMIYSTCTMNKIENEGVVEAIQKKHPECFEITFEKRFWPHIDETGGFFVCKLKKLKSLTYYQSQKEELSNKQVIDLSHSDKKILERYFEVQGIELDEESILKKYSNEMILIRGEKFREVRDRIYFFRLGKKIGNIENSTFNPSYYFGRDYVFNKAKKYEIRDEFGLDKYLRGAEIGLDLEKGIYQIIYSGETIGIGETNMNSALKNIFPKIWIRK